MKPKILVITPVRHIRGVSETLESFGDVTYLDDPSREEVSRTVADYQAIFTNPNKSKVFIDAALLDAAKNLKVICTASTGTNHIDKDSAKKRGLKVLSLTEERHVIERISSTAELAFSLTMASIRRILPSHQGALAGEWDYTRYIGRQMNGLTIGVVGYGRLGSMYARYCKALGSRVVVYDPFKQVPSDYEQLNDLEQLASISDVVSAHVHATEANTKMFGDSFFARMKPDALFVNTARGEVVCEESLVKFLKENPHAQAAVDVLFDEIRNRESSPLLVYAKKGSGQVLVTQHIGGMTREAQEIAYGHAAFLLKKEFT